MKVNKRYLKFYPSQRNDKKLIRSMKLNLFFPENPNLRDLWVKAINRRCWIPKPYSKICSAHFLPSDLNNTYYSNHVYVREGAVPSVFTAVPKHVQIQLHENTAESQTTVEEQPSTSTTKQESTSDWEGYQSSSEDPSKKRKIIEDPWVDEAYKILKSALKQENDCSTVFGEYIATKHRRYSAYTRSTVEHLISDILYNADIGKYDKANKLTNQPTSSIAGT